MNKLFFLDEKERASSFFKTFFCSNYVVRHGNSEWLPPMRKCQYEKTKKTKNQSGEKKKLDVLQRENMSNVQSAFLREYHRVRTQLRLAIFFFMTDISGYNGFCGKVEPRMGIISQLFIKRTLSSTISGVWGKMDLCFCKETTQPKMPSLCQKCGSSANDQMSKLPHLASSDKNTIMIISLL